MAEDKRARAESENDLAEACPRFEPRGELSSAELPRAFRPREKLFARGPASLAPGELLALVIGPGQRGRSGRSIAERLIRRYGLRGLARLPADAWIAESGVGQASAARLCAVFELGRRAYGDDASDQRPVVTGPAQAFEQVRNLTRARKEHLVGLYLDAQNAILYRETISVGSLNTTRAHPREILFPAVTHLALGFILAHNHPSGCLEPSTEDVEFTRAVRRAAAVMGIELYDHLIVARGGFVSMRERGLL